MNTDMNFFNKDFSEYPEYLFWQNANSFWRAAPNGCPDKSLIKVSITFV